MADIVDILIIIGLGMWLFLPAYIPNAAASLFGRHSKTMIDFGKSWRGKRILGDGKSWLGFFGGVLTGIALGLILIAVSSIWDPENYWGYGPFWNNISIIACLSVGALLGDICGAFIKRRLGMERGQKAPILDQYDFVAGAFILTAIFHFDFIFHNYFEGDHIFAFIFILLITFAIHRSVNIIGYKMGLNKEPW